MLTHAAAIFSALLIATGIAKVLRPSDSAKALGAISSSLGRAWVARALGLAEVTVGVAALAGVGGWAWSAQALLYASFVAWIRLALSSSVPISSCGCLGRPDTPPYWGHVVVDVLAVLFSIGAAVSGAGGPFAGSALELTGTLVVVAVGAMLGWVAIGDAARLSGLLRT